MTVAWKVSCGKAICFSPNIDTVVQSSVERPWDAVQNVGLAYAKLQTEIKV